MGHISYASVFDIEQDRPYAEEIHSGDLVRMGQNLFPHFTVMAVVGDKAWVRNVQTGADGIAPADRCRKVNGQTLQSI